MITDYAAELLSREMQETMRDERATMSVTDFSTGEEINLHLRKNSIKDTVFGFYLHTTIQMPLLLPNSSVLFIIRVTGTSLDGPGLSLCMSLHYFASYWI